MNVEGLVEGVTDKFVLQRIVSDCGGNLTECFGLQGCGYIKKKIGGFSVRANYGVPIIVLADLMDFDGECAPEALSALDVQWHERLIFRFVVRELESWILADREGTAKFLGVRLSFVPESPDLLDNPKQALINLARKGRSKAAKSMVPVTGMSSVVGPGYVSAISELMNGQWNLARAAASSPSLSKAVQRITELVTPAT